MHDRKLDYYRPHFATLERQNIEYLPAVWSSYGRPHARTWSVLRTLSKRIARRRGTACSAEVLQHLHGAITVEIWRRAAKQVFSCWPAGAGPVEDGTL